MQNSICKLIVKQSIAAILAQLGGMYNSKINFARTNTRVERQVNALINSASESTNAI
jgi:hypothetical protein